MPRPRPPFLRYDASRKWPWYVQKPGGKKYKIRETYGTDEFNEAYRLAMDAMAEAQAKKPAPRAKGGTLAWGWALYKTESAEWNSLSKSTRKQRNNIMTKVLETGGAAKITSIDRAAIQAGVDRRMHTPFQAKNFLQTMRGLFKWLVASREQHPGIIIKINPAADVTVKKPKTNGFPEWDYGEIIKFEEAYPIGTRERVLFDIYCYTGLRRGDAARVGRPHVRNNVIALATEKSQGRTWVHIPILDVLQRTLDAGPIGELTFFASDAGKPMAKESVGNFFHDACAAIGIKKSAHGLRKAAATRAAENGATTHELMAIFGWLDIKEAEIYTRAADRKRLAAQSIGRLNR